MPTRMPRARLRRLSRRAAFAAAVLAAYPAFVLGTTYAIVLDSGLPGGRHGPQDAYRHSLASAIVAYTGSPRWVDWVTRVMEDDGRGDAARAMDAHNNRLGARIGAKARSWTEMRAGIDAAVAAGDVQVQEPSRITWLPPERWRDHLY